MSSTANDERTAGGAGEETRPSLICQLQSGDFNLVGADNTIETTYLFPEEGKKSSFLLQSAMSISSDAEFYSIPAPAVIVIENGRTKNSVGSPFFLGGFQLVSTAKSVEVHLTDIEGKEVHLMTSKGIPYMKEDTSARWHKVICVVPGGPRPTSKLRIKLSSLLPVDTTAAKLQSIKLTARIAESLSPMSTSASPKTLATSGVDTIDGGFGSSPSKSPTSPLVDGQGKQRAMSPESAPLTQSDLGAAMAGVSFIARSTERGIDGAIQEQTRRLEQHVETCFMKLEQQVCSLKSILLIQQQLLQENQHIMQQQQRRIDDQNGQLTELVKHHKDLQVRVQALQGDVSILRCQVPDGIDDDEGHHHNENDAEINNHNGTDDDYLNDRTIPGVVLPIGDVCEDLESGHDSVPSKTEGVADRVNLAEIPLASNPIEKEISPDDLGTVKDESAGTSGLPVLSTSQGQDAFPVDNAVAKPDKSKEAPTKLSNGLFVPQKKPFQNDNNDEQCNFVANIEVTLIEDEPPTTADNYDADKEDDEKDVGLENVGGFGHDDHIHEKKEEDTIDHARQQYYDSFALQVQQRDRLEVVIPPVVCWTSPFQCLPSTTEDANM
jgi:hypothetical protein